MDTKSTKKDSLTAKSCRGIESFRSRPALQPSGCPYQNHEIQGVFCIQMIETFVSFVIFVVNDIRLSIQGTHRKP